MAQRNNQDEIQLRIRAAVDGLQDIGALLNELDTLGEDTSSASDEVGQLTTTLTDLADQKRLVSALEQTRARVEESRQAMQGAQGEADRLRRAYEQSAEGVDAQRRAAQQAAQQADVAKDAYQEQQRALQALQTQYRGIQEATTGARQAWRDAAERVKDLEEAISATGSASEEQARQLAQAQGAAEQARRGYQAQAEALGGLRDELAGQRRSVDDAKRAWEDYRDQSRTLNTELTASERALRSQGREVDKASAAADKARGSYDRQATTLRELGEDATAAGLDINNLSREQERLDNESKRAGDQVSRLATGLREQRAELREGVEVTGRARRGLREFGTEVERSNTFMERFKSTAAGVFTGLVGFAGLSAITRGVRNLTRAVGGFFTAGIGSARDFEEQLSRVRAVARPTAEEFEQLRRAADEAGATTQFTATQAAEGLEILSRAGLNAQQSIAALPQVLSVATAEGLALSEAAGLITDSLGIFREEVDQASRFADVLAQGAAQANTSMAELGQAIRDGGAEVLAAGQDFEFGVAALNAMAEAGIRGGRAGTALRNIMSQLSDPTSTARKELAKLGIETGDLVEVIDGLNQAGPRAQQAILAFGRESGPGLRALLGAGVEGLREFEDALRNAEGSAKEMADTAEDNLAGIWRGVQSATDAVRRGLVEQLMPQFREAALDLQARLQALANSESLTRLANRIGEVFEQGYARVKQFTESLLGAEGAAGGLEERFDSLLNKAEGVWRVASGIGNAFVAAFRATQSAAATVLTIVAELYSNVLNGLESVMGALRRVGLVSQEAYNTIAAHAHAAREAVVDLTADTLRYEQQAVEAGRKVVQAFTGAGAATRDVARATEEAANAAEGLDIELMALNDDIAANIAAMQGQASATQTAAERQTQLKDEIAATEAELDKYREKLRDGSEPQAAQRVGELRNRLSDLKGELREVSREAGSMAEGLDDAAKALGLTLDELRTGVSDSARGAIDAFETLARSGELTSEQLQVAFDEAWSRMDSPEEREAFKRSLQEMAEAGVEGAAQMLRAWQQAWDGLGAGSEEAANRIKQSLAEIQQANESAAKSSEEAGDAAEESANRAIISWAAWAEFAKNNQVSQEIAAGIKAWREAQLEAGIATDEHTAAILRQREEMERTRQEAEQLTQSLEQQLQRMREQLAQLRGDQDEVDRLRFERERAELEAQLQQARALGDAEAIRNAQELLNLQREAYQLQQQQTRERERPQAGSGGSTQQAAAGPAQVAQPTRATRIELVTPTGTAHLTADSDRDEQLLLDALGRDARRTTH